MWFEPLETNNYYGFWPWAIVAYLIRCSMCALMDVCLASLLPWHLVGWILVRRHEYKQRILTLQHMGWNVLFLYSWQTAAGGDISTSTALELSLFYFASTAAEVSADTGDEMLAVNEQDVKNFHISDFVGWRTTKGVYLIRFDLICAIQCAMMAELRLTCPFSHVFLHNLNPKSDASSQNP